LKGSGDDMKISERIELTIKHWVDIWSAPLRGWMGSWLSWGLELLLDAIAKKASINLKPLLDTMEATGKVPPELKPLLDEIREPTGEIGALFAQSAGSALIGGAVGKILDGILLPVAYGVNWITRNVRLNEAQYTALWLRGKITDIEHNENLRRLGLEDVEINNLKQLAEVRLDPMSWITAFRRKYEDFSKIEGDLKNQGWTDDRIKALKFFTLYYPSPAELIHWTAREVFEPDKVSKYGLMADADKLRREDFYKAGMDDEQINNHWIAHWEHASWMQVIEMLHRGIITEQDVKDWFPLVEIAPYWAENLIKVAYTWPTRVDVRRWWDMRTISEPRLKELYEGMGYRGENLDDYIRWTKVYTDFPMMIARFKNGWITEDDIRTWLRSLGIPEERIEQFIQEKTKPEAAARLSEELHLTKAEIVKGVKKEALSWQDGIELLMDLGLSEWEADYKLTIDVGALEGSPETYPEFKDITQKYRLAIGLESTKVPADVIEASKAMKDAQIALRDAESQNLADEELAPYLKTFSDAEYRYRALLVKWEAEKKKA